MNKNHNKETNNTILVIEDDDFIAQCIIETLEKAGYFTLLSKTAYDALDIIDKKNKTISLIILDIMLPRGINKSSVEDSYLKTLKNEKFTGVFIFKQVRDKYPTIPFIVNTALSYDENIYYFFNKQSKTVIANKSAHPSELLKTIDSLINFSTKYVPKIFIVHGHDEISKLQLKNYVQNSLNLGIPIILHELPSFGQHIFQKFERYARDIDLVFVLLTPDDKLASDKNEDIYRARQNVIFELGFFLGGMEKLKDRNKVILLHEGKIELPADIHG